jgi:succinate dehydrogenase hydrophobic anchor subunit
MEELKNAEPRYNPTNPLTSKVAQAKTTRRRWECYSSDSDQTTSEKTGTTEEHRETDEHVKTFRQIEEGAATEEIISEQMTTEETKSNDSATVKTNKVVFDDMYRTSRAGLGKLMYRQLCNSRSPSRNPKGDNIIMKMTRAYKRLIDARRILWKEGLGLAAAGLCYGGAHLAAWHTMFTSEVEMWMWRVSSMVTAVAAGGLVLELFIGAIIGETETIIQEAGRGHRLRKWFRYFCGFSIVGGLFPVLVARGFLFVESFISLRSLSEEAFCSVRWVETLPHFG